MNDVRKQILFNFCRHNRFLHIIEQNPTLQHDNSRLLLLEGNKNNIKNKDKKDNKRASSSSGGHSM
jgi:hypothetical protein